MLIFLFSYFRDIFICMVANFHFVFLMSQKWLNSMYSLTYFLFKIITFVNRLMFSYIFMVNVLMSSSSNVIACESLQSVYTAILVSPICLILINKHVEF